MNLNAYIARSGFCARRKAAVLIKEGKVAVNGRILTEPWYAVSEGDVVTVGGKRVSAGGHVYIIFNKPRGVTSTLEDRFAAKKITDYLPDKLGRVYPVGRLDKPSRGLIVLTNDGDLCYRMTHPRYEVEKEYIAVVEGEVDGATLNKLRCGIKDRDDYLKVRQAFVRKAEKDRSIVKIVVCEGKKRHIRRLFERLGFNVLDLERIRIGGLHLGDLKEGRYRVVDKETIMAYLFGPKRDGRAHHHDGMAKSGKKALPNKKSMV